MSRRIRPFPSLAALVAACALAGCADRPLPTASAAAAPRAASAASGGRLHVRGDFTGTQTWSVASTSPLLYRVEQTATGTIERVGEATVVWAVPQVRLDLLRRRVEILTPAWTIAMTLANGATIAGRYTFPGSTIHLDPFGNYTAIARLEVTSGTGSMAGARGKGTGVIRGNIVSGRFTVRLEGEAELAQP